MTIKEIAELAGTSRGTVDRVLNGRGNVRKDLADRINAIAKENNYTPNQLARALINSRRRFTIGVVINSLGNPFFDDVLSGIYKRAKYYKNYGLEVLVQEIKGYEEAEQIHAIDEIVGRGIDALAIMPLDVPGVIEKLKGLDLPIVTFNTDAEGIDKLAFVGCDYRNSGNLGGDLAKLILGKAGKVGIIIGSFHMRGHNLRVAGMRESLAEAPGIEIVATLENFDDEDVSYQVTQRMIAEYAPDLIYFGAAGLHGGVQAVIDSGKDIRVITVDETKFIKKCLKNGIISATVTQQPVEQGARAINILFNYMTEQKAPKEKNAYTENQVKLRSSQ